MKRVVLAIFTIGIICKGYGYETDHIEYDTQTGATYKKMYIDSSKIIVNNNRLFLKLDHQRVPLTSLFSDAYGMHLRTPIVNSWWQCFCGKHYPDNVTKCQDKSCVTNR